MVSLYIRWEARVSEMRAARRAYAKALHLRPDQGSAWGDAAAAFYLESQLRRATAQSAVDAEHLRVLRSTAERLTRGARPVKTSGICISDHSSLLQKYYKSRAALKAVSRLVPCSIHGKHGKYACALLGGITNKFKQARPTVAPSIT